MLPCLTVLFWVLVILLWYVSTFEKLKFSILCHYTLDCNYRKNYFYSFIPLINVFSIITAFKQTQTMLLTALNFTNLHLLTASSFLYIFQVVLSVQYGTLSVARKMPSLSTLLIEGNATQQLVLKGTVEDLNKVLKGDLENLNIQYISPLNWNIYTKSTVDTITAFAVRSKLKNWSLVIVCTIRVL